MISKEMKSLVDAAKDATYYNFTCRGGLIAEDVASISEDVAWEDLCNAIEKLKKAGKIK